VSARRIELEKEKDSRDLINVLPCGTVSTPRIEMEMKRLFPAVVFLMFWGSALHAAPVLFDNRADFNAAVGAHLLFTDFPLQHVPPTFDFTGNFGGFVVRQEGFELNWGAAIGPNGFHTEGQGGQAHLGVVLDRPLRAIGFDLLSATAATSPSYIPGVFPLPTPERVPTDLLFAFSTLAGEQGGRSVAPGTFFGALLYDDAFDFVSLRTSAGCLCSTAFSIDNLAVQAVPEPSTMLLLSAGLMGLVMVRQFRRR
jgi:hypothetical protein